MWDVVESTFDKKELDCHAFLIRDLNTTATSFATNHTHQTTPEQRDDSRTHSRRPNRAVVEMGDGKQNTSLSGRATRLSTTNGLPPLRSCP